MEYRIKKCEQGFVVTQHHIYDPKFGPDTFGTTSGFSSYEDAVEFIAAKFFGEKTHDEQPLSTVEQ